MAISRCTKEHFDEIVVHHGESWDRDLTLPLHRPMFIFEFGDTGIGMTMQGETNADGIPVLKGYLRPGHDRVVFRMQID